jgi:DNA/RNA-binding protein KIN17
MNANNVYQEVIQDKHHIHMNATKWTTLSDFVQYLGKTSKCIVEETERGWYVTYIERDPTILAQQENYERRVESEKREEEKFAKRMEQQRKEAAKLMDRAGIGLNVEASKLQRSEGDNPLEIQLGSIKTEKKVPRNKGIVFDDESDDDEESEAVKKVHTMQQIENRGSEPNLKPSNTLNEKESNTEVEIREDDSNKRRSNGIDIALKDELSISKRQKRDTGDDNELIDVRKKNWIRKDILVKIVSKKLENGKYYKRKAIVNEVNEKYYATIEILDSGPDANDGGQNVECHQDDLETVIPKEGKKVMILNGKGRGMEAILMKANHDKFYASLELVDDGTHDGTILKKVDFDDFSKAA